MPSILMTLLPVVLVTFTLSHCAPSPLQCIHQTSASTSRWHQLVNSDQRQGLSLLTGSNHLTNLQVKSSNMKNIHCLIFSGPTW